MQPGAPAGRATDVLDHGVGRIYDPVAHQPEPPAQVYVLEKGEIVGVETADFEE